MLRFPVVVDAGVVVGDAAFVFGVVDVDVPPGAFVEVDEEAMGEWSRSRILGGSIVRPVNDFG